MDEIESLLFHLSSPTIQNRTMICDILELLIKKAKYIIVLDADFGQRSFNFLKEIRGAPPKVLINKIDPVKRRVFLFSNKYDLREKQILEDIKQNKKIVIVSLIKGIVDNLFTVISEHNKNTKVIRHTSMTDDKLKQELININDFWIQYQVVIYSPTIDAGCDFNKEHFDRMYCYISSNSAPPRAFLQMTGRVRSLTENNIRVYYDISMNYTANNLYIPTTKEIEEFKINQNNKYNVGIVKNDENGDIRIIKKSVYTDLFSVNYLEKYKGKFRFIQELKEMILTKGFGYKNDDDDVDTIDDIPEEGDSKNTSISVDDIKININNDKIEQSTNHTTSSCSEKLEILNTEDICSEELHECEIRRNSSKATRIDKLKIKRYYFKKKLRLDNDISNKELFEYLNDWYGNEYVLDNMLYALNLKQETDYKDPLFKNIRNKVNYFYEIINLFGFTDVLDFETEITASDIFFKKLMSSKFTDFEKYKEVMEIFEKKIKFKNELKTEKYGIELKHLIRMFNIILNEFGIKIESNRKKITSIKWMYKYKLNNSMYKLKDIIEKIKTKINSNITQNDVYLFN